MHHLVTGHAKAIELNWEKPTFGESEWETLYKNPSWGVVFYGVDLGNKEQLGMAFSIYPYVRLPLTHGSKTRLNLRIGTGFGYANRAFNADNNHKNIALGSKINGTMGLQLDVERRFNNLLLSMSLSLTHFSNGAYKMPNLGYNIPHINLGLMYQVGADKEITDSQTFSKEPSQLHSFYVLGAFGLREIYPPEGGKYPVYTMCGQYLRNISKKFSWEGGIDVFYNSAVGQWLDDLNELNSNADIFQFGIHAGFLQQFGKIGVNLQMGYYAISKYKDNGPFYHRLNIRWKLNDSLFLLWGLKTHFAKADNFELGLGYRIK